jgi:hypothetical protein
MRIATTFLMAVLIVVPGLVDEKELSFENYALTEEMIAKAIEEGYTEKGNMMGLSLGRRRDVTSDDGHMNSSTGFALEIYTPYSWVSQQASEAAKRYKKFTREDVSEEMLEHVLRVFAYPDMPTVAAEVNRADTSEVENVVIRSTAKEDLEVLRPLAIDQGWEYGYTRSGEDVPYESKSAVFDLKRVAEISKLDEKGEFFVVVVGTKYNREFKIKTRHFEKLP